MILCICDRVFMSWKIQAGTQFWDESLAREVAENKLTEASVDRSDLFDFFFQDFKGGAFQSQHQQENLYLLCRLLCLALSIPVILLWCRYCIVLFAGIAAEGLVYGEAEGGESDENLYKAIISGLQPPWGPSKVSSCFSLSHVFSLSSGIRYYAT